MPTTPHVIVHMTDDMPELVIDGLTGEIIADHREALATVRLSIPAADQRAPIFADQAEADAFTNDLWDLTHADTHLDGLQALLDTAF